MSAEHARRNLVCASHHRAPEGFASWGGNMSGWSRRPFCWDAAGHAGDHWAQIERVDEHGNSPKKRDAQKMTWPNKLGIPKWLAETTHHGIAMMRAHGMSDEDILDGGEVEW